MKSQGQIAFGKKGMDDSPELTRVLPEQLRVIKEEIKPFISRDMKRKMMYDVPVVVSHLFLILVPMTPMLVLVLFSETENTARFEVGIGSIAAMYGRSITWRISSLDFLYRQWLLFEKQMQPQNIGILCALLGYVIVALAELAGYYSTHMFGDPIPPEEILEGEQENDANDDDDDDVFDNINKLQQNVMGAVRKLFHAVSQIDDKIIAAGQDVLTKDTESKEKLQKRLQSDLRDHAATTAMMIPGRKLRRLVKQLGLNPTVKSIVDNNIDRLKNNKKFWDEHKDVRPDLQPISGGAQRTRQTEEDSNYLGEYLTKLILKRWKREVKMRRLQKAFRRRFFDGLHMITHRLFRGFLLLLLAIIFGYLCLVLVWAILGAVLNPDKFLPYAAASATFITVTIAKYKQLWKMRKTIKRAVIEKVKAKFAATLKQIGVDNETIDRLSKGDLSKESMMKALEASSTELMQRSPLGTLANSIGVDPIAAARLASGDISAIVEMAESMGIDKAVMMLFVAVVRRDQEALTQAVEELAKTPGVPIKPEFAVILCNLASSAGQVDAKKLVKDAVNVFNQSAETDIIKDKDGQQIQLDMEDPHVNDLVKKIKEDGGRVVSMKIDPPVAEAVVALAGGQLSGLVDVAHRLSQAKPDLLPKPIACLVEIIYLKSTDQRMKALEAVVSLACSIEIGGIRIEERFMHGLAKIYNGDLDGLDDVFKVIGVTKGVALAKILIAIAQEDVTLMRGPLLTEFTREAEGILGLPPLSVNAGFMSALFAIVQGTDIKMEQIAASMNIPLAVGSSLVYVIETDRRETDDYDVHPIAWLAKEMGCKPAMLLGIIAVMDGHSNYDEALRLIGFCVAKVGVDSKVRLLMGDILDLLGSRTQHKVTAASNSIYPKLPPKFTELVEVGWLSKLVVIGRGMPIRGDEHSPNLVRNSPDSQGKILQVDEKHQINKQRRWKSFRASADFEKIVNALLGADRRLAQRAMEGNLSMEDFLKLLKRKANKDTKHIAAGQSVAAPLGLDVVKMIHGILHMGSVFPALLLDLLVKAGAITDQQQAMTKTVCSLPLLLTTSRTDMIQSIALELAKIIDVHPRTLALFMKTIAAPMQDVGQREEEVVDKEKLCKQMAKSLGMVNMESVEMFLHKYALIAESAREAADAIDQFSQAIKVPKFILKAIHAGSSGDSSHTFQIFLGNYIFCRSCRI